MANMDSLTELDKAIKEFTSVDIDRLKRPSLGEESLANDIVSRLTLIEKFVDQARRYAQLVNDTVVHDVRNTIANIAQAMCSNHPNISNKKRRSFKASTIRSRNPKTGSRHSLGRRCSIAAFSTMKASSARATWRWST